MAINLSNESSLGITILLSGVLCAPDAGAMKAAVELACNSLDRRRVDAYIAGVG